MLPACLFGSNFIAIRHAAPPAPSAAIEGLLALKSAADVARLAAAQARLLDNAAAQLAPGGVLVYCTCSLQKAEGEAQIEALLARTPDVRRLPITAQEIGGLSEAITMDGDVRLLPFHLAAYGGLDGFFIARLARA